MHSVFRPLQPATAVEHAVFARLTASPEPNLVVSKGTTLELYEVDPSLQSGTLRRVACTTLYGSARSVRVLHFGGDAARAILGSTAHQAGGGGGKAGAAAADSDAGDDDDDDDDLALDAELGAGRREARVVDVLLVTFAAAKMVFLAWDAFTRCFVTVGMLNFEDGAVGVGSAVRVFNGGVTQVTGLSALHTALVDPRLACVAMVVYETQLVVVPLQTGAADAPAPEDPLPADGEDSAAAGVRAAADRATSALVRAPYVVALDTIPSPTASSGVTGSVFDATFLNAYFQPTLAVLHEPLRNAQSRLAVYRHSMALSTVSLDVDAQTQSVIWNFSGLPTDATQVVAVPAPIGGALVVSLNAVMYFNQHHYVGVSLNGFSAATVDGDKYPLADNAVPLCIASDAARCLFVRPTTMLMSLKDGTLYAVQLDATARVVTAVHVRPMNISSALCSCLAVDDGGRYLFQGSRLGDSLFLLLRRTKAKLSRSLEFVASAARRRPAGRAALTAGIVGGDASDASDDDDAWLYEESGGGGGGGAGGDDDGDGVEGLIEMNLDSLPNVAPVAYTTMGLSAYSPTVLMDFPRAPQPRELVSCAGHGKHGALTVTTRSLRPAVATVLPLGGVTALFTACMVDAPPGTVSIVPLSHRHHTHLLASCTDGTTRVLSIKDDEMAEVTAEDDGAEFWFGSPTVGVASVMGGRRLLQATPAGVRLMRGDKAAGEDFVFPSPVVAVTAADPYAVVVLADGSTRVLTADLATDTYTAGDGVGAVEDAVVDVSPVTAAHLFQSTRLLEEAILRARGVEGLKPNPVSPGVYLLLARAGGSLQIVSMGAACRLVFECADAAFGAALLVDTTADALRQGVDVVPGGAAFPGAAGDGDDGGVGGGEDDGVPPAAGAGGAPTPVVGEGGIGGATRPSVTVVACVLHCMPDPTVVLALSNGDVMVYGVHPVAAHDLAVAPPAGGGPVGGAAVPSAPVPPTRPSLAGVFRMCRLPVTTVPTHSDVEAAMPANCLVPFTNINGWAGVAFLGPSPLVFLNAKGTVRGVALQAPTLDSGAVTGGTPPHCRPFAVPALTAFNTKVHPHGLALVYQDEVQFCDLPRSTDVVVEGDVAVRRIPIGETPHHVEFLPANSKPGVPLYAVVVSTETPRDPQLEEELAVKELQEDGDEYDQQAQRIGPDEDFVVPGEQGEPPLMENPFEVRLYLGGSWTHLSSFPFGFAEHALSVCEVSFTNERGRLQPLIAVGTGHVTPRGEDKLGHGNIYLLEIFTEEDESLSLKLVHKKPVKGNVSCLAYMHARERYLAASCGFKNPHQIALYGWLPGRGGRRELKLCAFYDADTYMVSMKVVKTFIMAADVYKSVSFIRFVEEASEPGGELILLAKDPAPVHVTCAEFMSYGGALCMVVADTEDNIQVFTYAPGSRESASVATLLSRVGDLHVGATVGNMVKARMNVVEGDTMPKFCTLLGMLDGSMAAMLPVDEMTFRRLVLLQKVLTYALPHAAGLNPKGFRLFASRVTHHATRAKSVLDGALLWTYLSLDRRLQRQLAKVIGTSQARVVASLRALDLGAFVF